MTPCGTRPGPLPLGTVTRRLRPWLPAFVWAAVLFALSSIPGSAIPAVPGWQVDKIVHGLIYLVLGFLCVRALAATTSLVGVPLVLAGTLIATAYGVTDELHQLLTPRRSCDWRDVVADAAGALVGSAIATSLNSHRRGKATPAL